MGYQPVRHSSNSIILGMSLDTPSPESHRFQRSIRTSWEIIRIIRDYVQSAAARIDAVFANRFRPEHQKDAEATLSKLELLPENIEIHIMKFLNYDDLYHFS
ncbi:hypothetical protein F4810DRAFT_711780 [Camillea tinctor]|nr:hypothetical protein F4810DRAFT_711780 [Camillea tinctor]